MNARPTAVLKKTAIALVLIAAAGGVGYWLAPSSSVSEDLHPVDQTLTARSVVQIDSITPLQELSTPEKTYEFIRQELDRQISIPAIDEYSLAGVAIKEIVSSARVPVFRYERTNDSVVVYVYNYALLDDHPAELHLSRDILSRLEEQNQFISEQYEDHFVVLWRNRDDIYAAVTRDNPDSLIKRIRPKG